MQFLKFTKSGTSLSWAGPKCIAFALVLLTLPTATLNAQDGEATLADLEQGSDRSPARYGWQSEPSLHPDDVVQADPEEDKAVILRDYRGLEYEYDANDELVLYYTEHKVVRVVQGDAVEDYNKFIIPMYGTIEVVDMKARSIAKDGTVIEVGREDIKEMENLENAGAFRLFALDGVEVGGEVEYYYTVKRSPRNFGREVFQENIPTRQAVFELISPANLIFEFMSYNGFPTLSDSLAGFKRRMIAESRDIPAAYSERYASYEPNLQRVEFTIAYNLFSREGRIMTADECGQSFLSVIYDYDKDDRKALKKLLGDLDVPKASLEKKIEKLERHFKGNVAIQDGAGPEFTKVERMLENRYASELGLIRLFAAALVEAEVPHELVIGTDKKRFPFDPDFDACNFLDEPFFYFPHSGKYLAPIQFECRYGLIPYEWTDTWALFVKPVLNEKEGEPDFEVRYIPDVEVEGHYDDMEVKVSFAENFQHVELNLRRSMAGYRAYILQPYFHRLPEETKTEVIESVLKSSGEDAEILESGALNTEEEDLYTGEPLVITGRLTNSSLLQRAGKRYLFNLGDVIGPQVEMYQERDRQFEIDMEYPHTYHRVIRVAIPEGYMFKGLDDINIDLAYKSSDGKPLMGFVSGYEIDGDELVVDVFEYYNKTKVPKEAWDEFRKVINAAADFNKVKLVLQEES